jgi:hypothetical protein
MASLPDLLGGVAEAIHKKVPQPPSGARKMIRRIERRQYFVVGNLPIKRRDQALESRIPNRAVDLVLVP